MNSTSIKRRANEDSLKKQEKLNLLTKNFKKLDESRKDNIRDLTRKLADIHCGGEIRGMAFLESHISPSNTLK